MLFKIYLAATPREIPLDERENIGDLSTVKFVKWPRYDGKRLVAHCIVNRPNWVTFKPLLTVNTSLFRSPFDFGIKLLVYLSIKKETTVDAGGDRTTLNHAEVLLSSMP